MTVDNAKGGWAQTSPPLAFWSLPIVWAQPQEQELGKMA